MKPIALGLATAALVACTGVPADPAPSSPPSPAEADEPPPAEAPAAEPDVARLGLETIGYARRPVIDKAARKANRDALKKHRASDFAGARTGFERAVDLSPDHDMARFNLACAMAQLGDLDAAGRELATLLRRDLNRFAGRWRGPDEDGDLAPLRTGPQAADIDALVEDLRDAFDRAHDAGIGAYLYDHSPHRVVLTTDGDPVPRGGTRGLVAGVWLPDASRFVPLSRGGTMAMLDLPNRRALVVSNSVDHLHCATVQTPPTVQWISTDGASPTSKVRVDESALGVDPGAVWEGVPLVSSVRLGWAGDDVLIDVVHAYDEDAEHRSVLTLSADGTTRRGPVRAFDGVSMRVLNEGSRYDAPLPTGYRLKRRTLQVPGLADPVSLDRGYDQVFVVGDDVVLLDWRFEVSDDGGTGTNDTTVARLDQATATIERIAGGRGPGWLAVSPDGALYIDVGGETRRWDSPDASSSTPTMPGLHLAMPLQDPFCDCCG